MVSNRPGFSNVWEVVPRGEVELNTGLQLTRSGDDEALALGQVFVRAGLSQRVELRLGLNSWVEVDGPGNEASGLEDPFVGLKFALFEGSGAVGWGSPAASLIVQSTLPVGAREFRADDAQPSVLMALAWDPAAQLHLDSNIGISSIDADSGRREELVTSHALGIGLSGGLALYFEYAGFYSTDDAHGDTHYGFVAMTLMPSSRLQFDIGVGRGFNGISPDDFVSLGVARRW